MPSKPHLDSTRISIAWQDPVMLQIGKAGLTDSTISEARRLLKKHKCFKVRALRSALDGELTKQMLFEALCERAGAELAGLRGNTAVIYKK
ncbi:MAG: YhbY family RNA-binding protein [Candidatus Thorarchaeota archaeon]